MPYKDLNSERAKASQRRRAMRSYRKRNPIVQHVRSKDPQERKQKAESRRLVYEYGITLEEMKGMVKLQNGLCALCMRPLPIEKNRDWCLDHDHETRKNRGVIHRKCNIGLGQFEDDLKLLKLAVAYLERHTCPSI